MGGDEIEIVANEDGTILLRKYHNDTAKILEELRDEWANEPAIVKLFDELIPLIKEKTD